MPKYVTETCPEDRIERALTQSQAILYLVTNAFEGKAEKGKFAMRDDIIFNAQYAALELVIDAQEAFEELLVEAKDKSRKQA